MPTECLSESLPLESVKLRGNSLERTLKIITVGWLFGSFWFNATSGTPLTNFALGLGASNFQFGILAALPFLASLISLPASLLIEATGQRKRIFLWGLYFQRGMWFPIALIPLWMVSHYGPSANQTAMLLFLVMIFLMHSGNAVGGPAWTSWMADIVPDRVRGKYFGRRRQWGMVTAIPAAWVGGWILDRYTGYGGNALLWACAGIFIIASLSGMADIFSFHYVPDVPSPPQREGSIFKAWREPLRNPSFLWFAGFVGTLTFAVSFMGQFTTLYVMTELGLVNRSGGHASNLNAITQMMLIIVPAFAQFAVYNVWGRAADRMGKRPLLALAGLGLFPVALGWCFVSRETIWLGYLLAAAGAAFWAGVETANFNMVLEVSGSNDETDKGGGSGFVAINSVIINISGCLGGLTAGFLSQWLKDFHWTLTGFKTINFYHVLFALSAVMRLLAVVIFLPHVHEPKARPTHETFRFMTSNIYNNLFNVILQPIQIIGLRKQKTPGKRVVRPTVGRTTPPVGTNRAP